MSNDTEGTQEAIPPFLDQILFGASGWRVPAEASPDDEALVAYLSGALTPAEASRTERGLVAHPAARRRVRDVAARLDALQARPWGEAEAAEDAVARAWRSLAAARLRVVPSARQHWAAAGWEAVRTQAAAGAADAQAAWAAFLSFADQWERERRIPRLAEARGASPSPAVTEALPPGVVVTTEVEVGETGDLTVRVWARDSAGQTSTALDGRTVRPALAAGGDAWPLASGQMRGGEASWHLPGAGNDLGLSPGPVSGLTVTFEAGPTAPEAVRVLYAGDAGTPVELWGTPRCEGGWLRLTLALPALTRAAQTGRLLAVSAAILPGLYQRLGTWPVSDWRDAPQTVAASYPGPDGEFDPATLRLDWETFTE